MHTVRYWSASCLGCILACLRPVNLMRLGVVLQRSPAYHQLARAFMIDVVNITAESVAHAAVTHTQVDEGFYHHPHSTLCAGAEGR